MTLSSCVLTILTLASTVSAGTIADAKAQPDSTVVTINSAVIASATDLISSSNSKSITIEDATGGITVYGVSADVDAILAIAGEGDLINITATKSSHNCLAQLNLKLGATTVTCVGSSSVPTPISVTTSDFQSSYNIETYESQIVKLSGVQFTTTGTFAYGSYTVTDGNNNVTVRIATSDLDLVGKPIPQGNIDLTGIAIQYDYSAPCDGWYQLQPRSTADIIGPPYGTSVKAYATEGGSPVTITLNGTDLDPGPDSLSYTIVSGSAAPNPLGPSSSMSFPTMTAPTGPGRPTASTVPTAPTPSPRAAPPITSTWAARALLLPRSSIRWRSSVPCRGRLTARMVISMRRRAHGSRGLRAPPLTALSRL